MTEAWPLADPIALAATTPAAGYAGRLEGEQPARRGHHQTLAGGHLEIEPGEVSGHFRGEVGVEHGGGDPLVLAKGGRDHRPHRDGDLEVGGEPLGELQLLCRVEVGADQGDCDRFRLAQPGSQGVEVVVVADAKRAGCKGGGTVDKGVVERRAGLTPDLDQVFESGARDQGSDRSPALEQGIGPGSRPMEEGGLGADTGISRRLCDGHRLIRRGGQLATADRLPVEHDHIGEGAPDVHPDGQGHPITLGSTWQ